MTLGFSTGLFQRFRNPRDQRDFVTAGDACHSHLLLCWLRQINSSSSSGGAVTAAAAAAHEVLLLG